VAEMRSRARRTSRLKKLWRKHGLTTVLLATLLGSGGAGVEDTILQRRLTAVQQQQTHTEQLLEASAHVGQASVQSHAERDEELTELTLSIVSDVREVVDAAKLDDKQKEEMEKRLQKAWDLLNRAKKRPRDDLLDCRSAHTTMIEIRDKADSLLRIELETSKPASNKNPRLAVPLERIQLKSSLATRIALKELLPHTEPGNRTEDYVEGVGLASDVLEEVLKSLRL